MSKDLKYLISKFATAKQLLRQGKYTYLFSRANIYFQQFVRRVAPNATLFFRPNSFLKNGTTARFNPLNVPTFDVSVADPRLKQIRVATILDDFSFLCWSPEFSLFPITPDNWAEVFNTEELDFLFVESAHAGSTGAWRGRLNKSGHADKQLLDIIQWCKKNQIPTVFWNKEDPAHFNDFIATATLFDYIFTTDSNLLLEYKRQAPEATVELLPFAAQPSIHNPTRNSTDTPGLRDRRWQKGDIAFAGTYFTQKYPERKEQLDLLLSAASNLSIKRDYTFTIFSRIDQSDKRYRFPKPMQSYIVGGLPAQKMLSANKEHKVFINVNSVVSSPTMCARRLFELPAAGAAVITTSTPATRHYFGSDELVEVDTLDAAEAALITLLDSPGYRERIVHRAQRNIWSNHCYHHRAHKLLETLNIAANCNCGSKKVSVICSSKRPENLRHLFQQFAGQTLSSKELILVTHGFEISTSKLSSLLELAEIDESVVTVYHAPSSWSLGRCLNTAVELSDGALISKFDDDDYYLPHYLEDMANAVAYSSADLVGKQAAYAYVKSRDAILLRRPSQEHIWTNFVAGPTLFGPRKTFEQHRFADVNTGEDTQFLRAIIRAGGKIYSADRFNFLQVRNSNHTWQVSDRDFLSQGKIETFGFNLLHVKA